MLAYEQVMPRVRLQIYHACACTTFQFHAHMRLLFAMWLCAIHTRPLESPQNNVFGAISATTWIYKIISKSYIKHVKILCVHCSMTWSFSMHPKKSQRAVVFLPRLVILHSAPDRLFTTNGFWDRMERWNGDTSIETSLWRLAGKDIAESVLLQPRNEEDDSKQFHLCMARVHLPACALTYQLNTLDTYIETYHATLRRIVYLHQVVKLELIYCHQRWQLQGPPENHCNCRQNFVSDNLPRSAGMSTYSRQDHFA